MLRLAYSYGDIGQSKQSKTWANKAYSRINKVPFNIQLTIKEIKAAVDKKPNELIKYCKQYLEINPYAIRQLYAIGWASFNTEQWQNAIDAFEQHLELNKKFDNKVWVWTYILLGRAYHKTGEHKKEKKIFKDANDLFPNEKAQFVYFQMVCSLSQGDTTEANEFLTELTAIGEQKGWSESTILYWLARAHDQTNNLIKAEQLYRRAVILNPHDTDLMNDLAYFLISNDINIEEGIELIIRVLENKPDNGNYLHTYGLGLYKQGKLKEAQEGLNKGWDLIPYYDHDHFLHIQEVEKAVASQNK